MDKNVRKVNPSILLGFLTRIKRGQDTNNNKNGNESFRTLVTIANLNRTNL